MSRKIIWINPKIITKISPISASPRTRHQRILKYKLKLKDGYLNGNWDKTTRDFKDLLCWKDYNLLKNNKETVYNWKPLYNSMKKKGYIQNTSGRYVEVGIGRDGDIIFVDGRHRLLLAMEFNISKIPVEVVYTHNHYNLGNIQLIKNEIIPEFIYDQLIKKWDKKINIYHSYQRIQNRYDLVKKYLPLLKDLNVLEIGCNSGIMMWSIMKYANSLIELEKREKYFKECQITNQYFNPIHKNKVAIYNESFKSFMLKKFSKGNFLTVNALYASFVLYHMNTEEIELLKTKILPQCKVVFIPNRKKERKIRKNPYYLNRDLCIKKLLEECGFKVKINLSFKPGFSVVVGTK